MAAEGSRILGRRVEPPNCRLIQVAMSF